MSKAKLLLSNKCPSSSSSSSSSCSFKIFSAEVSRKYRRIGLAGHNEALSSVTVTRASKGAVALDARNVSPTPLLGERKSSSLARLAWQQPCRTRNKIQDDEDQDLFLIIMVKQGMPGGFTSLALIIVDKNENEATKEDPRVEFWGQNCQ